MDENMNERDIASAETEPQIDQAMIQMAIDNMKSEQNLMGGALAGIAAALLGALIWAGVTVMTGYQIGWMAVGIGFMVGYAMRAMGRGIDSIFGVVGAVIALLGCLTGNLMTIIHFISLEYDIRYFDVLSRLTPSIVFEVMKASFSPMDILFYGLAVYEGYKLSFRKITESDLAITTQITEEHELPV